MDISARFNSRYTVSSAGCWEWQGYLYFGYGKFKIDGVGHGAHRASWMLHNGKIPAGLYVLHKCDNRCCVNPEHLFLGTAKDNAIDRETKQRGRDSKGESSGSNKLTTSQVNLILASTESSRALAKQFPVSDRMIRYIKARQNWGHV